MLQEHYPDEVAIYADTFDTAQEGSFDIAVLFVEKGMTLLRDRDPRGKLGFIISRQFTEADYGRPLRRLLAGNHWVDEIIDFEAGLVFRRCRCVHAGAGR